MTNILQNKLLQEGPICFRHVGQQAVLLCTNKIKRFVGVAYRHNLLVRDVLDLIEDRNCCAGRSTTSSALLARIKLNNSTTSLFQIVNEAAPSKQILNL